jgi:hypothetical protein
MKLDKLKTTSVKKSKVGKQLNHEVEKVKALEDNIGLRLDGVRMFLIENHKTK